MQEEQIKFETAKLAKEKGFNQMSTYYFSLKGISDTYENPYIDYDTLIYVNTQSLLQKWIRENHNMNIHIEVLNKRYYFQIKQIDPRIDKGMDLAVGPFDKYEQALEEALQQALKLI